MPDLRVIAAFLFILGGSGLTILIRSNRLVSLRLVDMVFLIASIVCLVAGAIVVVMVLRRH